MEVAQRLARASAVILVSSITLFLLGLAKSVIVARLLDNPDLIGLLGIFTSLSAIFGTVSSFGIPTAMTRYFALYRTGDRDKARPLIRGSFLLAVGLSALSGIVMFALASFLALEVYQRPELLPMFQVGAGYVVASSLLSLLAASLRGLRRMGMLAVSSVVQGASVAAASFFFVLWFGVLGAVFSLLLGVAIGLLLTIAFLGRALQGIKLSWVDGVDSSALRGVLAYSAPLLASGLVLYSALWGVETLLALRVSFHDLGLYRIGYGLYNMLVMVPAVLAVPLMPLLAELGSRDPDRVNPVFAGVLRVMMVVMLPFAVGIALASRFLITFLYGEVYAEADSVATLLVLAAVFVSLTPIVSSLLLGSDRSLAVFLLDALWAILFVPLALVLVETVGLVGLGYAHLLARLALLIVTLRYVQRTYALSLAPFRAPLALLLGTTGLTTAFVLVLPSSLLPLLAPPAAVALGIGALALLSPGERRMLRSSIRGILKPTPVPEDVLR